MAIDLGEKRIGIALSDETRTVAGAHSVMSRASRDDDFRRYRELIDEHQVTLLVFGLPTFLDGSDSDQTRWVRDYAQDMATRLKLPLVLQDEAHSTDRARQSMVARGMSKRKRQQQRDAVAAAFILQDYLDTCSGGEQPPEHNSYE